VGYFCRVVGVATNVDLQQSAFMYRNCFNFHQWGQDGSIELVQSIVIFNITHYKIYQNLGCVH
jgi:hypothetical protein